MKRMDITIDDIANELGISVSTVSRALNNHPRISDGTKQKVLRKAKELGYKPGMSDYGKQLVSSGQIVALVCPHLNSRIYRTALERLQAALMPRGILVSAFFSGNKADEEHRIVEKLLDLKPIAVVISSAVDTSDYSHFDKLISANIPLVCFNRVNFDYPTPKVIADNYQGAFEAASRMLNNGVHHIGVIVGSRRCPIYEEIVKGIKQATYKVGRAWNPEYVVNCSLDETSVEQAIEYLFALPDPPDAMIVARPQNALMLMAKLKEKNLQVPGDVPVVAFGSFEYNKFFLPSISTIEVDAGQMAGEVVKKVEEILLDPEEVRSNTTIVPTGLYVRGTSFR